MIFWSNFCIYLRNKVFVFLKICHFHLCLVETHLKTSLLLSASLRDGAIHVYLSSLLIVSPQTQQGGPTCFRPSLIELPASHLWTFIWLCTAECMSMLFSLLLLSDEPNRSTRGVVWFCLHSLRPGLSASPP